MPFGAFAAVVAAWGAASLYFTVAGRDSSGDCLCEYLPPNLDLAPEENAYTAIKTFTDNLPTNNTTLLATDYRLRKAYLDEVPRDPYDGEKLRWNAEKGYFWTKDWDGNFDGVVEFYPDGKPHWKKGNYHWVQLLSL